MENIIQPSKKKLVIDNNKSGDFVLECDNVNQDRFCSTVHATNTKPSIQDSDLKQISSQLLTTLQHFASLVEDKCVDVNYMEKEVYVTTIAQLQTENDLTLKYHNKERSMYYEVDEKIGKANESLLMQQKDHYQSLALLSNSHKLDLENSNKEIVDLQREHSKELSNIQKEQNNILVELLTNSLGNYKELSTMKEKQNHEFRMAKITRYDNRNSNGDD
jgi:hypothetical protein